MVLKLEKFGNWWKFMKINEDLWEIYSIKMMTLIVINDEGSIWQNQRWMTTKFLKYLIIISYND